MERSMIPAASARTRALVSVLNVAVIVLLLLVAVILEPLTVGRGNQGDIVILTPVGTAPSVAI
jgi:hypothetical protein